MINIHICDDETKELDKMSSLLLELSITSDLDYKIIRHTPETILLYFERCDRIVSPNILIMDIELGENLNGIDIAKKLKNKYQNNFNVIFRSNYSEMVFESFNAKPIYFMEKSKSDEFFKDKFQMLYKEIVSNRETIIVRDRKTNMNYVLSQQGIISIETESTINRTLLVTTNDSRQILIVGQLKKIEKELSSDFFKIYRSIIVNMAYISYFSNQGIIMKNNEYFPISKNNYKEFYEVYTKYVKRKFKVV